MNLLDTAIACGESKSVLDCSLDGWRVFSKSAPRT